MQLPRLSHLQQPSARSAFLFAVFITAAAFAGGLLLTQPQPRDVAPLARLIAAQSTAPMLRGDAIALRGLVEQGLASGGASGIEIIDMGGSSLASAGVISGERNGHSEPILLEQTVAGYVRVSAPPDTGHPQALWLTWLLASLGAGLLGLLLTRQPAQPAASPGPPPKRFAAVLNLLNHTEFKDSGALDARWKSNIAAVAAIAEARWRPLSGGGYYLEYTGISGEDALCLTLTALRLCARSTSVPARWRAALLEPGADAEERGLLYAAMADDLSVTMTTALAEELTPEDAALAAADSPLLDSFGEPLWRLVAPGQSLEAQVTELTSGLAAHHAP